MEIIEFTRSFNGTEYDVCAEVTEQGITLRLIKFECFANLVETLDSSLSPQQVQIAARFEFGKCLYEAASKLSAVGPCDPKGRPFLLG